MARNCERCPLNMKPSCPSNGESMPRPGRCIKAINKIFEPPINRALYFLMVNGEARSAFPMLRRESEEEEFAFLVSQNIRGNGPLDEKIQRIEVLSDGNNSKEYLVLPKQGDYAVHFGSNGERTILYGNDIIDY